MMNSTSYGDSYVGLCVSYVPADVTLALGNQSMTHDHHQQQVDIY